LTCGSRDQPPRFSSLCSPRSWCVALERAGLSGRGPNGCISVAGCW
jgi:hypothetical protein